MAVAPTMPPPPGYESANNPALRALLTRKRRRRPLIAPRLLGFAPAPRPSRGKRRTMTDAELRELELSRAFLCGARYSCWGWRRREPPRFGGVPHSSPRWELMLECGRAFYRGYDAATRARYARNRDWPA